MIGLYGPASAGKTAFAVEWSREAAGRFPDGRLVIDLRGSDTATALTPAEAVDEALRALGVPPEQLGQPDRQAQAKYRSLVAGRRMLILLDDAGADGPVRALLSEGSHLTVLVTARRPVAGAHAIAIAVLGGCTPPRHSGHLRRAP